MTKDKIERSNKRVFFFQNFQLISIRVSWKIKCGLNVERESHNRLRDYRHYRIVAHSRLNTMEQSAEESLTMKREGSASCRVVINPMFSVRVCAS